MSMNNKGLGRGLDALFGANSGQDAPAAANSPLFNVRLDALEPNPWQPRVDFPEDALRELASSIRSQGLLQPLLVRPSAREGFYQIVAGERRWRAARMAGLLELPAICRQLDDMEVKVATLIENIQRDDLNPVEEARGLLAIKEALNLNIEALAEKVGKSKSSIGYSLRLLKLDPETQEAIMDGSLTPAHARALLSLEDPAAIVSLRNEILTTDMTARAALDAAEAWQNERRFPWDDATPQAAAEGSETAEKMQRDPLINDIAKQIGLLLNCRAKISGNEQKGSINLKYESPDQLSELLEKLGLTLN